MTVLRCSASLATFEHKGRKSCIGTLVAGGEATIARCGVIEVLPDASIIADVSTRLSRTARVHLRLSLSLAPYGGLRLGLRPLSTAASPFAGRSAVCPQQQLCPNGTAGVLHVVSIDALELAVSCRRRALSQHLHNGVRYPPLRQPQCTFP